MQTGTLNSRFIARHIIILIFLTVLFCFLFFSLNSCGNKETEKSAEQAKPTPREIVVPVEVSQSKRMDLVSQITTTGSIVPCEEVTITSASSGVILAVNVQTGNSVTKGQLLVKLDSSFDEITLRELEADLKAADADLQSIDREGAKKRLEREKQLLKDGYSSQENFDRIAAEYRSALAQILGVEARIERLKASRDRVRKQIDESNILAPIEGKVSNRDCHRGQRISVGQPLMNIISIDPVLIEIEIGEKKIGGVQQGMTSEVSVEAYPADIFTAFVDTISPNADPTTRSFTVQLKADNSHEKLKPGMFARVRLPTQTKENSLVVPIDAIIRRDGQDIVFTIERDGEEKPRAQKTIVRTGLRYEGFIDIVEGLTDSDEIVVAGNIELQDGERVYIIGSEIETKKNEPKEPESAVTPSVEQEP